MNRIIKIIFSCAFFFAVMTIPVFGQQKKNYNEAMKAGISLLDSSKQSSDFIKAAESFGRLALHEKNDWLSAYYAGVCYALAAHEKKGKEIDPLCDQSEKYTAMADSLNHEHPEVLVLKAMIATARIGVNPAIRGQKFGNRATVFINDALKLDPNNPRAYLLKAQGVFYTPELFGGGAAKAKPLYETALEKYKTYKSKSSLYPHWGANIAKEQLAIINQKTKSK